MTAPVLEIRNLTVEVPASGGTARILDRVSLSVNAGESVGIVGESGCGKSMTALAVMGLLPEAARATGTVRLAGQQILDLDDGMMSLVRGRVVSMVFQEPMTALNPVRNIGDQVAEGLRLHLGLSPGKARREASSLLRRVGLPPERFSLDLYPHELSGGQRQRVVTAIALACGPRLLIADEPTTALDVTIQDQILDLLVRVAEEEGMALMMISHDLGVIAETTDRMSVMYAGRIVEEGTTAQVFSEMAHPYTRLLFAAMPAKGLIGGDGGRLATIPGQVPDPQERIRGCAFAPRCPRARSHCSQRVPNAHAVGTRGHTARCFYPGHGEASV